MVRGMRVTLLVGALALSALLVGACGDDEEDGGSDGGAAATATEAGTEATGAESDGAEVSVVLTEWTVTPGQSSAPAGEVTFMATNEGTTPHELVVIRSDGAVDGLPVEAGVVPEADVDLIGEIEEFAGGESQTISLSLEAGRYLLICNIAGHYDLGMRTEFTIE